MDRISERFRPRTLREVCGQSEIATLEAYAAQKTARCIGLLGPPACGKTSSSLAFMADCGATTGYPGLSYKNGSDFTGQDAKGEAKRTYDFLQCCPLFAECHDPHHVHGLVIEEVSKMAHDAVEFFKSALEVCLPPRAIVIVTSNDVSRFQDDDIGRAFLDRFEWFQFADTEEFRAAALKRARQIWQRVLTKPYGVEMPDEEQFLKWAEDMTGSGFSLRRVLGHIERRLAVVEHQKGSQHGVGMCAHPSGATESVTACDHAIS